MNTLEGEVSDVMALNQPTSLFMESFEDFVLRISTHRCPNEYI